MAADTRAQRIVWIDLEMTGLDPDHDRIIEAAILITDSELNVLAEGPELVVHQSDALLDGMDEWNTKHHGASGLTERVKASTITEAEAERQLLEFVKQYCDPHTAPLAGNSIWQDRRFLARYMPQLEQYLHYRLIDVSTLKELARRWKPAVIDSAPPKQGSHRALDDIRESLSELQHYRKGFLNCE